jgi:hypothetical protein
MHVITIGTKCGFRSGSLYRVSAHTQFLPLCSFLADLKDFKAYHRNFLPIEPPMLVAKIKVLSCIKIVELLKVSEQKKFSLKLNE